MGPLGRGPMTGRAAGYCAGQGSPGFSNPIRGMGPGMGFGRGGGGRRRRYTTGTPETEKNLLKSQAQLLQAQLDEIKKRLDDLAAKEAE